MAALSVLAAAAAQYGNGTASIPLAFLAPTVSSAGVLPSYNLSQGVNVSWTTPWEFTTVGVLQGPDSSGNWEQEILAANATRDVSSLVWNATALGRASLSTGGFVFRLQKGDEPNANCAQCSADSAVFAVADPNAQVSSAASSAATTSSSSSASSSTASSTTSSAAPSSTISAAPSTSSAASSTLATSTSPSAVAAGAESSASSAPSATPSSFIPPPFHLSTGEKVGIALGVGLGIIGILAFYALVHVLLKRRRERKAGGAAAGAAAGGVAGEKSGKLRPDSGESFQSARPEGWSFPQANQQEVPPAVVQQHHYQTPATQNQAPATTYQTPQTTEPHRPVSPIEHYETPPQLPGHYGAPQQQAPPHMVEHREEGAMF